MKRIIHLLLLGLWGFSSSCSSSVQLNEVANQGAEDKYIETKQMEPNLFANRMLLEDKLAVFVVLKAKQSPQAAREI